jgi:collagenase-like PrtC family protease
MNTIMHDAELDLARKQVWQLYEAGVDALIIQDMGLLELDLPPIQLHASTQCDIRTMEKAKFLGDVGFSQLVLARELTVDQSRNLEALIDAGIRSFKIEGRYKDMGYVKNITAHYRLLLDEILERRAVSFRFRAGRQRAHADILHAGRRQEL